ncbi:MAG TPA: hypothetical protein VMQ56_00345 [Terracidiphilus sp.]|nr:hypothetical protein [Terracidiphilus sp.]
MLNGMPAPILLDISILFTALSWAIGFYIASKRVYVFAPLAIGCFVCLAGYSLVSLNMPGRAVVPALIPLDLMLLWYVLRKPRQMVVAYLSTWAIYVVIHMALSGLLGYDSLIPAWKLHG